MSIPIRVKIAIQLGWTGCQPTYSLTLKGKISKKIVTWVGKPPGYHLKPPGYHHIPYHHIPYFEKDYQLYERWLRHLYEARK